MMAKGGKITRGSAVALADMYQRDRGRVLGSSGQRPDGETHDEDPFLLGKLQADCAAGAWASVNIWSGGKGGETDTNQNVKVWIRFAALKSGSWVIFAPVDQGYEAIAAFPCSS